ncbi:hypothetical protein ZTR_08998 [Talaromyces verruculosus]|nr:hypothetical protein ZTR_08998 [Talaromyces verruculosus]
MTVGRMVWFFDETRKLAKLSAQRFGTLFVLLDVFSFIVQVIGAVQIAILKSSHNTQLLGLHIYMAGIGLQQFFILCFTGLMITLIADCFNKRDATRIIFRLVDYGLGGEGKSGAITSHEAYEYGLDAAPILLAVFTLNFTHPGRILNGPESSWPHLSRREKRELKRQKKAAKAAGDGVYSSIALVSMSRQEEGGIDHNL